jgi:hypothetical protein
MAMTTKTTTHRSSLKRRIRQFYKALNQQEFDQCFEMIDPRIRRKPVSITRLQYETALRQFLDHFGSVNRIVIAVVVHDKEPTPLYEGRTFAVGKTTWTDRGGEEHEFAERWVFDDRAWFTRSTGFVVPSVPERQSSRKRSERALSLPRPAKRNGKSK